MSRRAPEKLTAEELRRRFRSHLAENAGIAAIALAASLAAGMVGYHWLAPMSWVDAFMNASMLLDPLDNDTAKLFAGAYALYCGVVFIATVGLVLAPIATHVLHRFHLDDKD